MSIRISAIICLLALAPACFSPDTPVLLSAGGSTSNATTTDDSATGAMNGEATNSPASDEGTTIDPQPADTSTSSEDTGPGDVTPPEILSFTPPDGSNQVFEEMIQIVFNEPMDQPSVAAAFPTGFDFTWNAAGTELELGYPWPFEDAPVLHQLVVPTSVTDLAGNGLATPFEVTVVLAALKTATIDYDPSLTGQTIPSGGTGSWLYAGDYSDNQIVYGGIGFSLAGLPSYGTILSLHKATFNSQVIHTAGDPNNPLLGGFLLDHVDFASVGAVDTAAVLESQFATLFAPGDIIVGDPISVDVLDQVSDSWSGGADRFQLRVRPNNTDGDGGLDTVYLRRGADENNAIVDGGVTDPDPANRARLEIEYFQ